MIATKLTEQQRRNLQFLKIYGAPRPCDVDKKVVSAALARLEALENAVEAAGGLCACGHTQETHGFCRNEGTDVIQSWCSIIDCNCAAFTPEAQP